MHFKSSRRAHAALASFILCALPSTTFAADTWTDPAPGVRHLHRVANYDHTPADQYVAHVLVIDLTHPAVSILATPPDQRGGVTSDFGSRNNLLAAWNTNFFANTSTPCGTMIGQGQAWDNAYPDGCDASIGVGDGRAEMFTTSAPIQAPPQPWMTEVVSGKPLPILEEGVPRYTFACGTPCNYQPRTGLGISQDGKTLYAVTVDGRQAASVGAGLDDLANIMLEVGAYNGVNLDGGGSTTMWIGSEGGVVNNPSGGAQRNVCCHMGVQYDNALVDPASYGAMLISSAGPTRPLQPGETATLSVTVENSGQRPWRAQQPLEVRLGTTSPNDRTSPFEHPSWQESARPTSLTADVSPGERATLEFQIQAPMTPGMYSESFALVVESVTWLDDAAVTFPIEVAAQNMPPEDMDTSTREDMSSQTDDMGLPDSDMVSAPTDMSGAPLPDASVETNEMGGSDGGATTVGTRSCAMVPPSPHAPGEALLVLGVLVLGWQRSGRGELPDE